MERVGKENYEQGGILLWPGFIPDSQSRALELKSRENRTEIFTSPSSRASSVGWLVGPGLLLLNTRGAVVLGKEVCELLKKK